MNREKLFMKITEKWHVKVLSVAAALILSIFYRMSTLENRIFTVPLKVEASQTLVPLHSFAGSARISLRGEANGIFPILEEDIEAYIDLGKYTNEGTYKIPVRIRKKGSALGVDPLEISVLPAEISITLEQKVSRSVPVFPAFRGTVEEGFELTSLSITPDSVNAEGPRSIMNSQLEFNTETIDLERRYEDFSILVNIINNNPLVTIHENRMIQYSGTISQISRQRNDFSSDNETGADGQ